MYKGVYNPESRVSFLSYNISSHGAMFGSEFIAKRVVASIQLVCITSFKSLRRPWPI